VGQTLPFFQIPSFQDTSETFDQKEFLGKYLLIDFWGTWCGPCIKEMPYLHEAFKKFKKKSFTILSIALDDEYQTVKQFRDNKWPMPWNNSVIPNNSDLDSSIRSKFEIDVIPKTLLVDQKGKIIATGLDLRGKKLIETLSSNIK
jgi:thiol-disulfide isomerase/thioredoxin